MAASGRSTESTPSCIFVFKEKTHDIKFGQLVLLPLEQGEKATIECRPAKNFDLGQGKGKNVTFNVQGGEVGLILDCRGRPIAIPDQDAARAAKMREWLKALKLRSE